MKIYLISNDQIEAIESFSLIQKAPPCKIIEPSMNLAISLNEGNFWENSGKC